LPAPEVDKIGMRVRLSVRLAKPLTLERTTVQVEVKSEQETQQVKHLIEAISGEMSRRQLMKALALRDRHENGFLETL
jgi:hypothetical protein